MEPADAAALSALVRRLSQLAEDFPEVAELDLNPVLADVGGCVAADARVRIRVSLPSSGPKTW